MSLFLSANHVAVSAYIIYTVTGYYMSVNSVNSYHTLVTALVVTVSLTLRGYERAPKVAVYRTAYCTIFITCRSRIAQERTTPSEN